ncbi:MAG: aldo/keto reductase [Myxococcales bacterium]|nr:aldo/keto reductase [Myxococcales bacterium]
MNRSARFVAWLVGLAVLGYFVVGHLFATLPVGLDWSAWPLGEIGREVFGAVGIQIHGAVMGGLWLLVILVAVMYFAARSANRAQKAHGVSAGRRRVVAALSAIGATALAGGAGALRGFFGVGESHDGWNGSGRGIGVDAQKTHPEYPDAWKGARVQGYRRLGRTGWVISDIVVGSGRVGRVAGETKGTEIVRRAIDRGVTYVDTSPDYSSTGSEAVVADAIEGVRDKVFIATKFCTPWGHLDAGSSVADYKKVIEDSLRRLRTDYADLAHVHACDTVERIMDPNLHEAADRLREEGKLRFIGFSTHTPNLVEVVKAAIDSGRFDVMMLAYHHGIWPQLGDLIKRARSEQDMGVVAMKTLKGAKHDGLAGFRNEASSYSQAALRWVLSNADVSAAIISFFEYQHVDEYLRASGGSLNPMTREDLAILEGYDEQIAGTHCAPHCGACLSSCPEGVPINDVLRHRMYFEDYRDEKEAMRLYSKLEVNASACASCSAPCTAACPLGIQIGERTAGAHEMLTLT